MYTDLMVIDMKVYPRNGEDCQGNFFSDWVGDATDIDGGMVSCSGSTKEEVLAALKEKLEEKNNFLRSTPLQQLQNMCDDEYGLMSGNIPRVIRIVNNWMQTVEERLKALEKK